jgi:hypothetical protein
MKILETQFKQREYDGKWEKIVKVIDYDNKYVYKSESGHRLTYIPEKWMTVGVFDWLLQLDV